jgi:uncharacterized protein (DUF983 family)
MKESAPKKDAVRSGPRCPFCGSTETELFSLFGQQLLTAQYYCNSCHTPFEHIKGDDVLKDAQAENSGLSERKASYDNDDRAYSG